MQDRESPGQLTLQAMSCAGEPCSLSKSFGRAGGTIGRAPECDLVLPDATRTVSRIHARVIWREGSYLLVCLGSNAVMLGDRVLATGEEAPLRDGLLAHVGSYVIKVLLPPAPAPAKERSLTTHTTPAALARNPLAAPEPLPPRPSDLMMPDDPLRQQGTRAEGAIGIDLFGGAPAAAEAVRAAPKADAFRGSESDHVAPQHLPMAAAMIPADYDLLGDGKAPGAAVRASHAQDDTIKALLEGLGLPYLDSRLSPAELARLAGSLLREAIHGTMGALITRSLTKRESHIDVTVLGQQANNPLKFFPDTDTALTQLLTGAHRGYMAPGRAVTEAFDDLRSHELAVIAATRSAVADVVDACGPRAIEEELTREGLDKVFQLNRKARSWELLQRRHEEMRGEPLQRRFAEKFSAAYAAHLDKIRRGRE